MELTSLDALLEEQLKDLYSAENQLLKTLPKMTEAVTNDTVRAAFTNHLEETKEQVKRLEKVAEMLGISLKGKKCHGMEGLLKEGAEMLEEDGEDAVLDAGIIAAAQRVEHYEIASYGCVIAFAKQLGLDDVVDLLQLSLDEEKNTDELLNRIAEEEVNVEAAGLVEEFEEDEELEADIENDLEEEEGEKPTSRRQ